MHGFYLSLECGNCEEEIIYGLCATTDEHKGLPLIPADFGAQERYHCDNCGAMVYTGELEYETAGGRDMDADDSDEGTESESAVGV